MRVVSVVAAMTALLVFTGGSAPTANALFLKKTLKKVKQVAKKASDKVKKGVTGAATTVKTALLRGKDAVKNALYSLGNKVKDAAQTVSNVAHTMVAAFEKDGLAAIVETLRALKLCRAKSFSRNVSAPAAARFTMLFSSDPQLPWWGPVVGSACPDGKGHDDCVLKSSREANRDQVDAMNSLQSLGRWPASLDGNDVTKPMGVVINGDLTAFAHTWQWYLFEKYWNKSVGKGRALQLNAFYGLGNHDYSNNLNDCWSTVPQYLPHKKNGCAKFSVDYIKRMVACKNVGNFRDEWVTSFDKGSLAYSFEIGDYHFVQLHNYPTFSAKEVDVSPSVGWLKEDAANATRRGKRIVLNFHDASQRPALFSNPPAEFMASIAGARVVAVFAGHIHENWGFQGNVFGTNIPVFLSGSSDNRKFLLAEFGASSFKVAVVDSGGGKPKFHESGKAKNAMRVTFK